MAGGSGNTSGWASPALSSALTPVSLGRAARGGSGGGLGGCGSRRSGSSGGLAGGGGRAGAGAARVVEGRANVTPADVGEDNMGGRVLGQDGGRVALGAAARAAASTVEPIHELAVVIPNTEDQDHATAERLAHGGQAAEGSSRAVRRLAP